MTELTLDQLTDAVAGGAVAIRSRLKLDPAGGPGTKVMPPTYGVPDNAPHKYAIEDRVDVNGEISRTVLLDSVASQANRMEEALLEAWERGDIEMPVAYVDFTGEPDLAYIGRITTLEAPHRITDAIFRDSLLDDTLFRLSDIGRQVTEATPRCATAVLAYCPHGLLFGMWDSTGPKGGLGSKFQRAMVSEIVGMNAQLGKTVGGRLDPLNIRSAKELYKAADPNEFWTFDKEQAAKSAKKMAPAEFNHGNVPPSIDESAGGVTITHAEQVAVISLPALRRLRFPIDNEGDQIEPDRVQEAETAARTLVAAIGVCALAYQIDFDLRSRCLLIPRHAQRVEIVGRDGGEPEVGSITRESAQQMLADAASAAAKHGLGFTDRDLVLTPAPKFVDLIKRSRELDTKEEPES